MINPVLMVFHGQVWIGVYDWRRRGKKPRAANGKRPPGQKRSAKFLRLKQYQLPLSAWRLYISSAGAGASIILTDRETGGGGGVAAYCLVWEQREEKRLESWFGQNLIHAFLVS